MKQALERLLRCPACGTAPMRTEAGSCDAREIRTGQLRCTACGKGYEIKEGIVDLLTGFASSEIIEEQRFDASSTFTEEEARIFLRDEYLLGLPEKGWHAKLPNHWRFNALNFDDIVARAALGAGSRILDLGTGSCWTTRLLAGRGYDCVALDINAERYTGLGSGDVYFNAEGIYFERVLGDLSNPPFADASFDGIFANAAVHHVSDLPGTFRNFARILKSGGVIALASEPVGGIYKKIFKCEVMKKALAEGANEHVYSVLAWGRAARAAGLEPDMYLPRESTRIKFEKVAPLNAMMKSPPIDRFAWACFRAALWPILILRGFGLNLLFRKPA